MSELGIYLLGFALLVVGLALTASLLGIPTAWIGIGIIILIASGTLRAISRTRRRGSPNR